MPVDEQKKGFLVALMNHLQDLNNFRIVLFMSEYVHLPDIYKTFIPAEPLMVSAVLF